MPIDAYFFDLDGTLYDLECGLLTEVNNRIAAWMRKTVDLPEEDIHPLRERLYAQYGGTLVGLALEYGSDYYASMRYCHDIPLEKYIGPAPKVRGALELLRGRKYVFTSSYRFYTTKVLHTLGILDCFDGIIDALDVFPTVKPAPEAFEKAFRMTAEDDIRRCAFLDDHVRNINTAHEAGFFTVQVGQEPPSPLADARIPRVEDLVSIGEFFTEEDPKL